MDIRGATYVGIKRKKCTRVYPHGCEEEEKAHSPKK